MTHLFLDTNIFLHFKWYNEIPWTDVVGKDTHVVVVAPVVISELDKHKNHPTKKINQRARTVITRLEEIADNKVQGNLIFQNSMPSDAGFQKYNLSKSSADDCLLVSLLEFSGDAGATTVLITNDLALKLKAIALNIKCVRLQDEYRIPEELDETEKQLDVARKELADLKHRQPRVTLQFENSNNQLYLTPSEFNQTVDEWDYVKTHSQKNKAEYDYMRMPSKEELESKNEKFPFRIPAIAMFSSLSQEQMDRYNASLDAYHIAYEKYLREEYQYQLQRSKTFAVKFELSNAGTLPAEDIDVYLHFPDGFDVLEEVEDAPVKPNPPYRPNSRFDFGPPMPIFADIGSPHDFASRISQNSGPSLTRLEKTNSYDVEFALHTLKHNQSQALPTLYIRYEDVSDMRSFTIEYSLLISNVPKKVEGNLHVIFKKTSDPKSK